MVRTRPASRGRCDQARQIESLLAGSPRPDVAERVAHAVGLPAAPHPRGDVLGGTQLFEALAQPGPLVVDLDDLHWAEPTLLDLIEHIVDWAAAPILLLCPARPELLDDRPGLGWREDERDRDPARAAPGGGCDA